MTLVGHQIELLRQHLMALRQSTAIDAAHLETILDDTIESLAAADQAFTAARQNTLLTAFVEHTPAAVAMFDRDMRYLVVSQRWMHDYRLADQPIIGRSHYEVFPEIPEQLKAVHRRCLAGAVERADAEPFPRLDGTVDWVRWEVRPWYTDDGAIGGIMVFSEVITEQIKAQEALRASEARFRTLIEQAPIAIAISRDLKFVYTNPKFAEMYGFDSADELIGQSITERVDPEQRAVFEARAQQREQDLPVESEYEALAVRKDGTPFYVMSSVNRIMLADGPATLGFFQDITERKQAEERIRKLNHILAVLSDVNQAIVRIRQIPVLFETICQIAIEKGGFCIAQVGLLDTENGRIKLVTHTGMAGDYLAKQDIVLGDEARERDPIIRAVYTGEPVISNDITHSPYREALRDEVLQCGCRAVGAFPLKVAGEVRGVISLYSSEPDFFDHDELRLLDEMAGDVSFAMEYSEQEAQRLLAEVALYESEERYRILVELSPDAIFIHREGYFTFANPSGLKLLGAHHLDDLNGKPVMEMIHPDFREIALNQLQHMNEGGNSANWIEERFIRLDGTAVDVEVTAVRLPLQDNSVIQVVARDITQRKQVEAALRQSEERYAAFIAHSFEGILRTEFDQPIDITLPIETQIDLIYENAYMAECNQALVEMYHLSSIEEMIGMRLIEAHGSTDNPINRAAFRKFIGNNYKSTNNETLEYTAKGQPIWFLSTTIGIVESGYLVRMWETTIDITERKQAETAVQERDRLQHALDKEKELSDLKTRFVSLVSHEFRTPLAAIQTASELLQHYTDRMTEEQKIGRLTMIRTQVERMTKMLEQVLTISRAERGKLDFNPALLDVKLFCQDIVDTLQESARTHCLVLAVEGDSRERALDAEIVQHILTNLLTNAVKYSPTDSQVYLDVTCQPEQVVFQVRDEGIGIPPEDQVHLFEPFHRARNVGHIAGTGLGLTIVKQMVERHGGRIMFDSVLGVGTTVTVIIPTHLSAENDADTTM